MLTHFNVQKNIISNLSHYRDIRARIKVTFNGRGNHTLDTFYKKKGIPTHIQALIEKGLERLFSSRNVYLSTDTPFYASDFVELNLKDLGLKYEVIINRFFSTYFLSEITSINFYKEPRSHYSMKIEYNQLHGEDGSAMLTKIERAKIIDSILSSL